MNCEQCGVKSKYPICWSCRQKSERENAYNLGYQTGYLKGQHDVPTFLTLPRWRQLVQLCHPDKHQESKTATEVSQWLQDNKPIG